MMGSPCFRFAGALIVLALLTSTRARASGFSGISFGGELGSVISANPTAIYYNPGALGWSGTQLMLDVTFAMRETTWVHAQGLGDAPEPPGFEGANYGTAHSFLAAGGPQAGASFQLGEHLVVGGGWFIPYGGGSFAFDRNERFANSMYPGAADGIARWHGYEAGLRFLFFTAGAAVRFGPLSIGATGNLILASILIKRALTSSGTNMIEREQRATVDVSQTTGSFGVGAMLEVIPKTMWFGASYQAQPGLGELTLDGTYTVDATVNVMDATSTRPLTLHQALPDIIRVGSRWRPLDTFEMRISGSFTRWSVNQTQCAGLRGLPCVVNAMGSAVPGSGVIKNLRREWNDTFGIRGGLSYWPVPILELFTGLGFENAAIPDETLDPVAVDANNITASLGARLQVFETWFGALSYEHQQFLPRDNTGRSQLADPMIGAATRAADGGGRYTAWFGMIHLNLAKTF